LITRILKIIYNTAKLANFDKILLIKYLEVLKHQFDSIKTSDFDYNLPDGKIAKHPLSERDNSKLLIYNPAGISESLFNNLNNYIPANSLLILNNTKVVHARLLFHRSTGSKIEIFLLEPITPEEYTLSFGDNHKVIWKCIVGNLKRWKEEVLKMQIGDGSATLFAKKLSINGESVDIEFTWNNSSLSFAKIIELCGVVPIPPYLNRDSEPDDNQRYQTIYAKPEGSVAAPTAGLHFTENVFKSLQNKSIDIHYITLHIGAGTFKPVKSEKIVEHEMHTEHFIVRRQTLEKLLNNSSKITCVGTTSLRALESIYWLGVKALNNALTEPYHINQWEPYELPQDIDIHITFEALLEVLKRQNTDFISASTQILIVPGYKVRTVDFLITNFHQPKSTLLMLVTAFIGDNWRKVYDYALTNDFRFLSYGDSSILTNNE